MISEKTIREEQYNSASLSLSEELAEVPMTLPQRSRIEDILDDMEDVFIKANS